VLPQNIEHKSKIQILPGYGIFVGLIVILIHIIVIIDGFFDFQEGIITLSEMYLIFFIELLLFGGLEFSIYYFFISILSLDSQNGIQIFSHFSKLVAAWDQIESIKLTLNLKEESTPINHGLLMLFVKPYLYHTRRVSFTIKTFSGEVKKIMLQVNLNNINHILHILTDLKLFKSDRTTVDISKKKKKKEKKNRKKEIFREQWQFNCSTSYQEIILYSFFIRDKSGGDWQQKYSRNAQIMNGVGLISVVTIIGFLFSWVLRVPVFSNLPLSLLLICLVSVCIGLFLTIFTLEMRGSANIY
jgi:hypothetical protein